MGDAIHDNVPALAAVPGLQLVAGYATGTPDIKWTMADWQQFPRDILISIDQGYQSPATTVSTVRDVEPGAWTPQAAVDRASWPVLRPTIYCNRNDLSREGGVLQSGWRGDLWLAYPGWQPGQPLPTAPGCTYVAVQNQLDVQAAYDLSVVLDPAWPARKKPAVIILRVQMPAPINAAQTFLYAPGAAPQHIISEADQAAFAAAGLPVIDVSYPQYQALAGQF